MLIITGMAIDYGDDERFNISFEGINLGGQQEDSPVMPLIVEATGETVLDAIRDTSRRIPSYMYFGNMQTVIIGREVAENGDLIELMDYFMRDEVTRESMNFIISKEDKAAPMLKSKGINSNIIGDEIDQIIEDDDAISAGTNNYELYKLFNHVHSSVRTDLAVPCLGLVDNNGEASPEIMGIAVFEDGAMVDLIDADTAKYFLFLTNNISGGAISVDLADGTADAAIVDIASSKSSFSFESGESFKIKVDIKVKAKISEILQNKRETDEIAVEEVKFYSELAKQDIEENALKLVQKMQKQYRTDVFGFGNRFYRSNLALWRKLTDESFEKWIDIYSNAEVEINASVDITNTKSLK